MDRTVINVGQDGVQRVTHSTEGGATGHTFTITGLDSTQHRSWQDEYTLVRSQWTPDGRSLVYLNDNCTRKPVLTVISLVDGKRTELRYKQDIGGMAVPVGVTNDGHMLAFFEHDTPDSGELVEFSLQESAVPRRLAIKLPYPCSVVSVALSPQRDRLAWLLLVKGEPRPTVPSDLESRDLLLCGMRSEIWISRLDGSGMREILTEEPLITKGEEVTDFPRELRWLPSGKHLGFLYNFALYTVPAD